MRIYRIIILFNLLFVINTNCISFGEKYIYQKEKCIRLNISNQKELFEMYGKPEIVLKLKNNISIMKYSYNKYIFVHMFNMGSKEIYFYIKNNKIIKADKLLGTNFSIQEEKDLDRSFIGCPK